MDSYVAAWFGLEGIGAILHRHFHPNGPKVPCGTCGNTAGVWRDKKLAGIEHVICTVASEALDDREISDLADIRNQIVHGLRSMGELRTDAALLAPDLQVSLGAGILTVLGREFEGGAGGRWSAMLPRDYRIRPDFRFDMKFAGELSDYRPYYGEWPGFEWSFGKENSRQESAGNYVLRAGVEVKWALTEIADKSLDDQGMVKFERLGSEYIDFPSTDPEWESKPPQVKEWRQEVLNPSWQRLLDDAANSASAAAEDSES